MVGEHISVPAVVVDYEVDGWVVLGVLLVYFWWW